MKPGVVLYEFMCGIVPFGEDCEDPYEVYMMITSEALDYPSYFLTEENREAKRFIEQLLNSTPDARLGGSYGKLKVHAWFENYDFVIFF